MSEHTSNYSIAVESFKMESPWVQMTLFMMNRLQSFFNCSEDHILGSIQLEQSSNSILEEK